MLYTTYTCPRLTWNTVPLVTRTVIIFNPGLGQVLQFTTNGHSPYIADGDRLQGLDSVQTFRAIILLKSLPEFQRECLVLIALLS